MYIWQKKNLICSHPTSICFQIVPSKLTVIYHHCKTYCNLLYLWVKTPISHPRVRAVSIAFKAIIYRVTFEYIRGKLSHKHIVLKFWFHTVPFSETPFHFFPDYPKPSFKEYDALNEAFPDFPSPLWLTLCQNTYNVNYLQQLYYSTSCHLLSTDHMSAPCQTSYT